MKEFKCKKCGNMKHAPQIWPNYCPMCGERVMANHCRNQPLSHIRNMDSRESLQEEESCLLKDN